MQQLISGIFDLSQYTSQRDQDNARMIYRITVIMVALFSLYTLAPNNVGTILITQVFRYWPQTIQVCVFYIVAVATIWAVRSGNLAFGRAGPSVMWFFGTVMPSMFVSAFADPEDGLVVAGLMVFATLLLRQPGLLISTPVAVLSVIVGVLYRQTLFGPDAFMPLDNMIDAFRMTLILGGLAYLGYLFLKEEDRLIERAEAGQRRAEKERQAIAGALADLSKEMNATLDINRIFELALAKIEEVLACDSVAIHLLEPSKEVMTIVAARGFQNNDELIGTTFTLARGNTVLRAVQTRETLVIPDVQKVEDWEKERDFEGVKTIRSWIGAPLIVHDTVLGALTIDRLQPDSFDDEKGEIATAFAEQIAVAVNNARLFQEVRRRAEEANTLREAGAVVASTLDQAEAIDVILSQLKRVIPYESASVQLLQDGEMVVVGGGGWLYPEISTGLRFPVPGEDPNTVIVKTRQPMAINRVKDSDYPTLRDKAHEALQAWLGVPLIVGDEVIGMLTLDKGEPDYFTQERIDLVAAFAGQVAVAIQNARLYNQTLAHAQAMEEARQVAETANQAKTTFLANMSHELRTPLNAILGYAGLLEQETYGPLNAEQSKRLQRVISNGTHLLSLIEDVLDVSRIEAGKLILNPEAFPISSMIEKVTTDVRPLAERNNNTLDVVWETPPGQIVADEVRVRQALLNLLTNAAKFTSNGAISLTVRHETGTTGEEVAFIVKDTGIGIAADKMPLLFREFSQIDASSTRRYGGTGLGLALSQRLAHMMGGSISAESVEGVGSTFTLRLPVDTTQYVLVGMVQANP